MMNLPFSTLSAPLLRGPIAEDDIERQHGTAGRFKSDRRGDAISGASHQEFVAIGTGENRGTRVGVGILKIRPQRAIDAGIKIIAECRSGQRDVVDRPRIGVIGAIAFCRQRNCT